MRIHILVNKYAGAGKAPEIMENIKPLLEGHDVTTSYTEKTPENFIEYIESNGDINYLVAIGGDGTMNYAVQALAGKNTILIPIDAGTGSDLSRTIGRVNVSHLNEIISSQHYREIDLARIQVNGTSKYFANIMESGLGGNVMLKVNSVKRRTSLTFMSAILASLISAQPVKATVKIENESITADILDLIIANGQYYGKGIHASPDSDMGDGFLDVHLIKFMPKYKVMMRLNSLRNGSYTSYHEVINRRAKSIHVICQSTVEIDGETMKVDEYTVSVCHNALKIFPLNH